MNWASEGASGTDDRVFCCRRRDRYERWGARMVYNRLKRKLRDVSILDGLTKSATEAGRNEEDWSSW